jgi:phosphate-selective porin
LKSARCAIPALLLLLLATPARSQTQGPGDAPIDPAEANAGSDVPPLRIRGVTLSGSLQADAIRTTHDLLDEYRDQFLIRRTRVGLAGNLTPNVGWNLSVEFANQPGLRNAFVQVRFTRYLSARLGQSTPLTSIERTTSPTVIEFIDRTRLTSQLTYPQDIGLTLLNDKPIARWINYSAAVINGAGFNRADDNDAKDLVGRLELTPPSLKHTSLVVSGSSGNQPRGNRTRQSAGFQVDAAAAKITAEALRENDNGLAIRDGYLVSGVYRIKARRVRPNFRMVELTARYFSFNDPLSARGLPGHVDEDASAAKGGFVPVTTREFQGGGNYYANRNVRVMVNVVVPVDDRTAPGTTLVSRFQMVF